MKPQLRPVARLHPSMLKSSSHWCFLALGNGIVASNDSILKLDSNHSAALLVRQGTVDVRIHDGDSVYPCALQEDGSVKPECWPIENGEEEIVEWRGVVVSVQTTEQWDEDLVKYVPGKWVGLTAENCWTPHSEQLRNDAQPSPRKINSVITWVWEPINRGDNDS